MHPSRRPEGHSYQLGPIPDKRDLQGSPVRLRYEYCGLSQGTRGRIMFIYQDRLRAQVMFDQTILIVPTWSLHIPGLH